MAGHRRPNLKDSQWRPYTKPTASHQNTQHNHTGPETVLDTAGVQCKIARGCQTSFTRREAYERKPSRLMMYVMFFYDFMSLLLVINNTKFFFSFKHSTAHRFSRYKLFSNQAIFRTAYYQKTESSPVSFVSPTVDRIMAQTCLRMTLMQFTDLSSFTDTLRCVHTSGATCQIHLTPAVSLLEELLM